jgi:hypothetical protein
MPPEKILDVVAVDGLAAVESELPTEGLETSKRSKSDPATSQRLDDIRDATPRRTRNQPADPILESCAYSQSIHSDMSKSCTLLGVIKQGQNW